MRHNVALYFSLQTSCTNTIDRCVHSGCVNMGSGENPHKFSLYPPQWTIEHNIIISISGGPAFILSYVESLNYIFSHFPKWGEYKERSKGNPYCLFPVDSPHLQPSSPCGIIQSPRPDGVPIRVCLQSGAEGIWKTRN